MVVSAVNEIWPRTIMYMTVNPIVLNAPVIKESCLLKKNEK
jgi:hypothetical protein